MFPFAREVRSVVFAWRFVFLSRFVPGSPGLTMLLEKRGFISICDFSVLLGLSRFLPGLTGVSVFDFVAVLIRMHFQKTVRHI